MNQRNGLRLGVLGLAGVLLGLGVAQATPTTPASATLSSTNSPLIFTGGPDYVSNPTPLPAGVNGPVCESAAGQAPLCDNYTVNLDASLAAYATSNPTAVVDIFLAWQSATGQDDYDDYVYDQNGKLLGSGTASGPTPEDVKLTLATLLKNSVTSLNVTIVPFTADGASYTGTVTLEIPPVTGGNGTPYILPTSPAGIPRYQTYAAPTQFDNFQNEESIGVDWITGATLFSALSGTQCQPANTVLDCGLTLKTTYNLATSPAETTWSAVTADNQFASLDPILFTFDSLGHTISDQLISALGYPPGCSLMAETDNDGTSWLPDEGCGLPTSGSDHPTVGGGPYSTAVPLPAPNPVFSDAVYFCSQEIETAYCARSDDGGLTFAPGVPIYNDVANTPVSGGTCQGLHGHVKVSPVDGTVYVPNANCNGGPGLAVSTDDGLTWTMRTVPNATTIDSTSGAGSDPSLWVASDGTVYFAWQGPDTQGNDAHLYVAESQDEGVTWTHIQDVSGPDGIVNTVFPAVVAGDGDRAAVAFLGAKAPGNYQAADYAGNFRLYIATTYDGGQTWKMVDATPGAPVQAPGGICTGGSGCSGTNRNLLDFIDANLDKTGHVVVAYAEGCTGVCVTTNGATNTFDSLPSIAYQSGGDPLFASHDPTEPAAPQAPLLVSATAQSAGAVLLTWDLPDTGGSPITNYVVNRGTSPGGETSLVTLSAAKTSYLDTGAQAGATYYYTVSAENAEGPSAPGNEVKSGNAVAIPSPCTLPGVTVVSQAPGSQTGAPANAENDITGVSFAEPYNTATATNPTLLITMNIENLSALQALPPNTDWQVAFNYNGQTYFVDMDTDMNGVLSGTTSGTPVTPEFEYGVTVPGTGTGGSTITFGPIAGNYSTATNTITLELPTKLIIPPQSGCSLTSCTPGTPGSASPPAAGAQLTGITGSVTDLVGAVGTGLLVTVDKTPTGTYTLAGNLSCAPNLPPIAALTALPTSGTVPFAVAFDASGSVEPSADTVDHIVSYTFNFGDGSSPLTQATPTLSHTYTAAGTYQAGVTVTNSRGATGTRGVTITANPGTVAPLASLTASPASGTAPLSVSFDASGSSDPNSGGSITQYTFTFGDGSAPVTQSSATASHRYTTAGSYTASVTVTDSEGGTATATASVTVSASSGGGGTGGSGPVAALSASPTSGTAPLAVAFDASGSTAPSGDTLTQYTFNFGDNTASVTQSTPTVSHTYTAAGTYQAYGTVTDSAGQSSSPAVVPVTVTLTITVNPGGITAELSATPTSGFAPLPVTFDGSKSFDLNGTIQSFTFNFGDGSTVTQTVPVATHVYTVAGTYTPTLTVSDNQGHTAVARASVGVSPPVRQNPTPPSPGGGGFDLLSLLGLLGLGGLRRRGAPRR